MTQPTPTTPAKPGDWMKSDQWMANAGHFLAGVGAVAITTTWSRAWTPVLCTSGALVLYGLVKEYWIDLRYESNETVASSTEDFIGYMLGAAAAWLNFLAARGTL